MDFYNPSPSARTKGNWSAEEDRRLARLVQEHGEGCWSFIARHFAGRIGKQCRERWHNQLRPDIKRDAWDDAEEQLLIEVHQKLGNKWSDIAKLIPGRTENAVKNHWNATLRRKDAAGVDGQGRPLTRLKQYMKDAAAGSKRRGNRNNRGAKNREKRTNTSPNEGDGGEIAENVKRQRLQEDLGAGDGAGGDQIAGAALIAPNFQAPFLDLPLAPREELRTSFNLPMNASQRHSSSTSEADQLLEWLTNSAAVGGGGAGVGGGENIIGGLDDVPALKFPFYSDTNFPAFPSFPNSGQGGLGLSLGGGGGGREIFCTPEPPLLASPLISPSKTSSGLGNPYPSCMHGLGTMKHIDHPALHSYNNQSAVQNPLRHFGRERSKSAASSRSAAAFQGATTTTSDTAALMNVPITHLGINRTTPLSQNRDSFAVADEGAGFFSPPPAPRKMAKVGVEDQAAAEDGRQGNGRERVKSRQIAPHAFLSPDSATSPAS